MRLVMKEEVRRTLSQRERRVVNDAYLTRSAILLLLYKKNGAYHILFTKRTEDVTYHKGQICFPGGSYRDDDESVKITALRESFEETGIDVQDVEVLGVLDDEVTTTGFIITPVVGVLAYSPQFKVNPAEIDEIIEVPVADLLNKDNFREELEFHEGIPYPSYFYEYQGHVIWGATARILRRFLELGLPTLSE
jgi:8-oxo-dGTP pyrophosphatase MutT (NUDIX family)